jgi:hypothetical protein
MNNQESQYLFKEKVLDGRTNKEACIEIEEFKYSQIKFTELERELKKKETIIRHLNEEVESLNKKLSKQKNETLKSGLGLTGKKEVEHKVERGATLLNIKRVIRFTEPDKDYMKSDLAKGLFMPSTVVQEIIDFLNAYTNIKFEIKGTRFTRR